MSPVREGVGPGWTVPDIGVDRSRYDLRPKRK